MPKTNDTALKNLLARMCSELYCPSYPVKTYAAADIPTRETVDEYLPKIKKIFGKMVMESQN